MKTSKSVLFIIALLFAIMSNAVFANAQAADVTVINNLDLTKWVVNSGNEAVAHTENNAPDGIILGGEGNGEIFDYSYLNSISRSNLMLDFFIDTEVMVFSDNSNPELFIEVLCDNRTAYYFHYNFFSESYTVSLNIGELSYQSSNLKYKDDGQLQLRCALDQITNYETAETVNAWNVVFGIPKTASAIKNDAYHQRINQFDDETFQEIADALDAVSENESVNLRIRAEQNGDTDNYGKMSLRLCQIATDCFYNYLVLPTSYIDINKLSYTEVDFSFELPSGDEYSCGGYIIQRYKDNAPDKSYLYTSRYSNTLTDKRLKQNTDYAYEVTALKNISVSNRAACNKIVFKIDRLSVHTEKGNPINFIVGLIITVVAISLCMLAYIYFYDIKKLLKREKQK